MNLVIGAQKIVSATKADECMKLSTTIWQRWLEPRAAHWPASRLLADHRALHKTHHTPLSPPTRTET